MNPAPAKKYYTVKEAAAILAVSTNTLYKYLDEGKIRSRRFGQGRFKIPATELAAYINPQNAVREADLKNASLNPTGQPSMLVDQNAAGAFAPAVATDQKNVSDSMSEDVEVEDSQIPAAISADDGSSISPGVNDKVLWRLFKGLAFLGMGIIYIFTANRIFDSSSTPFLNESKAILNLIMPYGLIVAGFLTLADVFYEEKLRKIDPLIHILSAITLSYFGFVAAINGEYGRFVFAATFAVVIVSHIISGINHEGSFMEAFAKFTAISSLIGGVVVILNPAFFPVPAFVELIKAHPGIFGILWFGLLSVPSLFILTENGKKSLFFSGLFFFVSGIMTLIIATQQTIDSQWDVAFISYLMVIFGFFLVWWCSSNFVIRREKFNILAFSFLWATSAVLIGFYVIANISKQVEKEKESIIVSNLHSNINKFKSYLDETQSLLTSYAGNQSTVAVISQSDSEAAIAQAKEIYEKSTFARRVLIYNSEGYAVGVYPRETLSQGTNFSSRDYFQQTKSSYKGIVSSIFSSVNGNKAIMVTEPVFKDNSFYGMIGLSLDLDKISADLQSGVGDGYLVHAIDQSGEYAFGSRPEDRGKKVSELDYLNYNKNDQYINKNIKIYKESMTNPDYTFYLQVPENSLASSSSTVNLLLSVFVIVNSVFSIFTGVSLVLRKKNYLTGGSQTKSILNPGLEVGGI